MRQAIVLVVLCLGLAAGNARAASLIGEDILIRLDVQGSPLQTITVGAGPEISGLASPRGFPWAWTVDFGASDFTITAVATEDVDGDPEFFNPDISFATITPGLIPILAGTLTLSEQIAINGLTNGALAGDFDSSSAVSVGSLSGPRLSFRIERDRGASGSTDVAPAGSFVRWSGTIALTESADVPLPAPGLLLLAGLAALGLVRGRRRA